MNTMPVRGNVGKGVEESEGNCKMVKKMTDYLHPDVLTLVFARMHVKTLMRCTLVCKSWHSLINSYDFKITHLSWKKPDGLFLMCSRNVESSEEIYALDWDNGKLSKCADFDMSSRPAYDNYYRIIGSCNGIFCLSDDMWRQRNKVILWNPAIRKWLRIPHHGTVSRSRASYRVTGFGFDSDSKDYKVVRITNHYGFEIPAEVFVYSLSGQTWRIVSHLEPKLRFLSPPAPQAMLNGTLHWIISDDRAERNIIVSFNLSNELFHTLELPSAVPFTMLSPMTLTLKPAVIEGSLAMVESDERRCCIWLMQVYGVCSSWTKKVDVDLNRGVDRLIGIRYNGDLLIEKRGDLYSYDPRLTKETPRPLYSNFDPSRFLRNPYPHFPGLIGRKRLRFHDSFGDNQDPVAQLLLFIENYRESLILFGMQTVVGGYESESEIEEETESGEEDTESSDDTTDSEDEEEEI